jgi:hypothetical protein
VNPMGYTSGIYGPSKQPQPKIVTYTDNSHVSITPSTAPTIPANNSNNVSKRKHINKTRAVDATPPTPTGTTISARMRD